MVALAALFQRKKKKKNSIKTQIQRARATYLTAAPGAKGSSSKTGDLSSLITPHKLNSNVRGLNKSRAGRRARVESASTSRHCETVHLRFWLPPISANMACDSIFQILFLDRACDPGSDAEISRSKMLLCLEACDGKIQVLSASQNERR